MEPVYIHQHLTSRISFGNYEMDDVLFVIIPFMLFLNLNLPMLIGLPMVGAGWYMMSKWNEFKQKKLRGFRQHFLYRFGLMKIDSFPPAWLKETNGN